MDMMNSAGPDMVRIRREALDRMGAGCRGWDSSSIPDIGIDLNQQDDPMDHVPGIVHLLRRDTDHMGAGVAALRGVRAIGNIPAIRQFQKEIFANVWSDLLATMEDRLPPAAYRVRAFCTHDGAIPFDVHGSKWSFKPLHADRHALLFCHHYAPVTGVRGGDLQVVDARSLLSDAGMGFDDAFDWSSQAHDEARPVLKPRLAARALEVYGMTLTVDDDTLFFINNLPGAGIMHGATPVTVAAETWERTFHRLTVQDGRHD